MNKIDLNTITYEQIVKILGIFNKMLESGLLEAIKAMKNCCEDNPDGIIDLC